MPLVRRVVAHGLAVPPIGVLCSKLDLGCLVGWPREGEVDCALRDISLSKRLIIDVLTGSSGKSTVPFMWIVCRVPSPKSIVTEASGSRRPRPN